MDLKKASGCFPHKASVRTMHEVHLAQLSGSRHMCNTFSFLLLRSILLFIKAWKPRSAGEWPVSPGDHSWGTSLITLANSTNWRVSPGVPCRENFFFWEKHWISQKRNFLSWVWWTRRVVSRSFFGNFQIFKVDCDRNICQPLETSCIKGKMLLLFPPNCNSPFLWARFDGDHVREIETITGYVYWDLLCLRWRMTAHAELVQEPHGTKNPVSTPSSSGAFLDTVVGTGDGSG